MVSGLCYNPAMARNPSRKSKAKYDPAALRGWHAHIYYAPSSKKTAAKLRSAIEDNFDTRVGRWHDEAVGPHPISMYQIAFGAELFSDFVPWLALNREGLTILLHPDSTGDHIADHTDHALWMGKVLRLNLKQYE